MSLIVRAAQLAAFCHRSDYRKHNGKPYITHPIRVAGRVATLPEATDELVATAYLHDTVEDAATPEIRVAVCDEIKAKCGETVLIFVVALTNPSKGSALSRAERKRMDRDHLRGCSRPVKLVKLIDRIDNLNESTTDVQLGLDVNFKFNLLYTDESELLLTEALRGVDEALESEFVRALTGLRAACRAANAKL